MVLIPVLSFDIEKPVLEVGSCTASFYLDVNLITFTVCRSHFDPYGWRTKVGHILKLLIQSFELDSGLKVNWSKSHIVGIALTNSECLQMANLFGVLSQRLAFRILGLLFWSSPKKREFWNTVIDRCKSKLTRWKANYRCFVGRITLITLSNLSICYLSLFKVTKGVE